jgi:hypothetical protein
VRCKEITLSELSDTPRADWPQIGDIIPNHDGDRPPATDYFNGKQVRLEGPIRADSKFDRDACHWQEDGRVKSTEIYLRADSTEKLEALMAVTPPALRRGCFRAPDTLLAMLRTTKAVRRYAKR